MGDWIPLMDYAMKTGISLSTLRRYIKADKIRYKIENGRYLLQLDGEATAKPAVRPFSRKTAADPTVQQLQSRIRTLAAELKKAQEEIAELKTLIAFYEESVVRGNPAGSRLNV